MIQVFTSRPGIPAGHLNPAYGNPFAQQDSAVVPWWDNVNSFKVPIPSDGTLRNLRVTEAAALGAGAATLTVYKNGVATALAVTITSPAQSADNTTDEVSVVDGDEIAIAWSVSGGAGRGEATFSFEFEGVTARTSIYCSAGFPRGAGTTHKGPFDGWCQWDNDTEGVRTGNVVGPPGVITRLRGLTRLAPGLGNSIVLNLVLNGVLQDGTGGTVDTTATITGSATTAVASFALPVTTGDIVSVRQVLDYTQTDVASGGSGTSIGVAFRANVDGYSQYCGSGIDANLSNGDVRYSDPATIQNLVWDTTEANVEQLGAIRTFQLIGLIVRLTGDAGAASSGKSYTFDGRVNGASPGGGPSATVTENSDVGSGTGAMTVASGDTFAIRSSPSGTPDLQQAIWTFGMFVATPILAVTQLVGLVVQDRAPDPAVIAPPTGGGTVPAGTNPAAGVDPCNQRALTAYAHFTPVGGTTKRYGKITINQGIADEPRIDTFGPVTRGLTNRSGGDLRGTRVSCSLWDGDRVLRGLDATASLVEGLLEYFVSTPAAIRAGSTPRRVFAGKVTHSKPGSERMFRLDASDWLQALLDLSPPPLYPKRTFTLATFPNMANNPSDPVSPGNPTMLGKVIPAGYGLLSDELKGLNAVGVCPGIFTGVRYIPPPIDMDMDEYVFFCHAPAGNPLSLFAPIAPFGTALTPARIKYTAATLPVATDWLVPWHAEWAQAFGSSAPYRDINNERLCVAYGRGPSSLLARTGQVPVVINVGGAEDVGDGSGNLIESLPLQAAHALINFFLQTYTTGNWLASPAIGSYSLVNTASFSTVKTRSEARVPTAGWVGAFLLAWNGQGVTLQSFARTLYEHGIYLGPNKDGQIMASTIDPSATPVRTIVDVTDVTERSFQADTQRHEIRTRFTYRHGRLYTPPLAEPTPTTGAALPSSLRRPQAEWDVDNQSDTHALVSKYDRQMDIDFELTRDAATAVDLKDLHKEVLPPGPRVAEVNDGPCAMNVELGDLVLLTHHEGVDAAGWTGRKLRAEQHTLILDGDQDAFSVKLGLLDVEDLP